MHRLGPKQREKLHIHIDRDIDGWAGRQAGKYRQMVRQFRRRERRTNRQIDRQRRG